jgi:hypothetical protein
LATAPARFEWASRLRVFLNELRVRAFTLGSTSEFKPEHVFATFKGKEGRREKYRVLCTYSLQDALIAAAFAAYFRDLIDAGLADACYAFRPPKSGRVITHHDAVDDLRKFASGVPAARRLWVAECDIQGFFDSVPQDLARRSLLDLAAGQGSTVDNRALSFLDAFLAGYDYETAAGEARRSVAGVRNLEFFDPRKPKAPAKPCTASRLGIPQGSAMSGVIANAVLSPGDSVCLGQLTGTRHSFYARYCDDILVVSSNRRATARALKGYSAVLYTLGLPAHSPQPVPEYHSVGRRQFWKVKSKLPYRWRGPSRGSGVPWVGFLGYQLSRDGTIRIRLNSIMKEVGKQQAVVDDILSRVDKAVQDKKRLGTPGKHAVRRIGMLRHWLLHHLISFGVGYPVDWTIRPSSGSVSWCRGFRLLADAPVDRSLLRRLDRVRMAALGRLTGRISGLIEKGVVTEITTKEPRAGREEGTRSFSLHFPGRPLSYFAQFESGPGRVPPPVRSEAPPTEGEAIDSRPG